MKNKSLVYLYFFVFFVAFFLRSYHLGERFAFTMDEEYQAFLVKNIIDQHHIPLIGVNVGGTGLYLGPYFTWASVVPLWLSQFHPIGTAWAAVFIGSLTCIALMASIQVLTKKPVWAFIIGLLYAVNPMVVAYDHKYWNPSLVPLLTIGWFISLIQLKKNPWWILGVVGCLGLALHTHYSLFILLVPTAWWLYRHPKSIQVILKKPMTRHISLKDPLLWSIILFWGLVMPTILFELRHDFLQTKALWTLLQTIGHSSGINITFGQRLDMIREFFDQVTWLGWQVDLAALLNNCATLGSLVALPFIGFLWLGVGAVAYYYIKPKPIMFLIIISILTGMMAFLVWPMAVASYYLLPILPLLFYGLIGVVTIFHSSGRYQRLGIGLLVMVIGIWTTQSLSPKHSLGLNSKLAVFSTIKNYMGTAPYHLEVVGQCYQFEGYRYLSEVAGLKPASSYMDPYFDWLYGPSTEEAVYDVVIFPDLIATPDPLWERWQRTWASETIKTKIGNQEVLMLKR